MDKIDVSVSIASGALSALIVDSFIVGDILLTNANEWGTKHVEQFVIDIAKHKDKNGKVTDLYSAVKFLEENYKLPADSLEHSFGGAAHHHLYDFSHHPTPIGWFFSIATQFTGTVYGTDKLGAFKPEKLASGGVDGLFQSPIEKIWNGTVTWFFHMVSDMAGSSGTIRKGGHGTGLPGPILSFLKEVSSNESIRKLVGKAGDTDRDKFSVMVQNLFNGRFLADHTADGRIIKGTEVPFDLRTEIGLGHELTKQAIPIVINECVVRAFFSISRFVKELERIGASSFDDLRNVDFKAFLPFNNRELSQMLLIASSSFSAVDITAAGVKAAIKNPGNKYGFAKDFLLGINYVGVLRLGLAGLGVAIPNEKLEKCYDDFAQISEKLNNNEVVAAINNTPMGVVPLAIKVVKTCRDSVSEYQEAKEERIRIQSECDEQIRMLTEYREDIEKEVSVYLISNLIVFDEAFEQMDAAKLNGNSNAYIGANAKIQKQLGKDMQFHSQDEFDGLMDSDEDFKL